MIHKEQGSLLPKSFSRLLLLTLVMKGANTAMTLVGVQAHVITGMISLELLTVIERLSTVLSKKEICVLNALSLYTGRTGTTELVLNVSRIVKYVIKTPWSVSLVEKDTGLTTKPKVVQMNGLRMLLVTLLKIAYR